MRLILSTTLTLMVGNMFQQMYTIVDASVVGRGIGLKALAALGSADWFNWLFFSLVIGFAQGFSIPVAQAFGAKDYDELRRNVVNATSLGLLTAAAITAIALLVVTPVLNTMGTPDEVRPMAAAYLRVLFSGIPIVMGYNLLSGILRALGDSRSPLLAMVLSSLINILLDCLFVFGFGWGVESAAAATVIAQASSFIFCLFRIKNAPFLVREGACENCFGVKEGMLRYIGIKTGTLSEHAARIRYVSGVHEIADSIWLVPHRRAEYSAIALRNDLYTIKDGECRPDDFAHEQSLVIETEKGLVVFNSCSHAGMTNILADIREMLGRCDVRAYVGGLHLYKMTDEELDALSGEIRTTGIEHIFTGHCTGDHAFTFLKARLGGRIEQFSSGFHYCFG